MRVAIICILLALAVYADEEVAAAAVGGEEAVLTLDSTNFDAALEANDHIMVEFYAPWCGHCKALAPEYEAAAEALKDDGIALAKVDCTEDRDVCSRFDVQGFPTVKWFTNGKPSDYPGARKTDAIVNFCRSRVGPAAEEVAADDVDEFKAKTAVSVLGFFTASEGDEYELFGEIAELYRDDYTFGFSFDAALAAEFGASVPGVVVLRDFADPIAYTGDFDETISEFIVNESFELVAEISGENYQKYVERGLPFYWLFVEGSEFADKSNFGPTIAAANDIAEGFKGQYSFVYLDGVLFEQFRESLGLTGELPSVLVQNNDLKYVFDGEVSVDTLKSFGQGVIDGDIAPFLKSEPIPESNDGPVSVVVGKSFDDIVFDEDKNVLLEFYAPWCGHCKNLAPIYEELGQHFQDNENVVIAKIDATANDAPYPVQGFPTLVYFGAGAKEDPDEYSGGRDLDSMIAYINGQIGVEGAKDEL